MTFSEAIKAGFNKFLVLSGRSSRSEYWYWILFMVLVAVILSFLGLSTGGSFLGMVASLFFFLANLSVSVRRLHDLNKSGWWVLIGIIPVLGTLILWAWFTIQGTVGPNEYGDDPLTA